MRGRETREGEIGGCVQGRSLGLLIADDNLSDINLFKMALGTHRVAHEVHTVHHGESGLAAFGLRRYANASSPSFTMVRSTSGQ